MFNVTRLLDVAAGEHDRVLASIRSAAERSNALRWIVEPTDPGSRNGGDVLAHLRFAAHSDWQAVEPEFSRSLDDSAITRINGVTYHGAATRTGEPGTVYRSLLLRVQPDARPDALAQFERELTSMPNYVTTIRAWQLSRVVEPVGTTAWTHVFEQEFTDVDGLVGPYLMHPIHWAVVDRWFDPETPDVIVRDRVCHSFCIASRAVLRPS